jgi:hypothetical protein
MIQLTEEQFKEFIEAAHRAGQHNQTGCDPSAYEAMVYYEKVVKNNAVLPHVSKCTTCGADTDNSDGLCYVCKCRGLDAYE